jgi:hypothetical protein
MTQAEGSFVGLAKQVAKGTPNVTDGDFKYVLFRNSSLAPNPIVIPLDQEVGGGAMLRSLVKVGVNSGGGLDIIPRPQTLGDFLYGALGDVASAALGAGGFTHTFTLPTDQFDAPWYTIRSAPGNLWGEQFQDCRVSGLVISFAGARFLEGAVQFLGGLPAKVSTAAWAAAAKVDSGPQFLSPLGTIALPTATEAKVLSGSVAFGLAIPLDEQYIVGSYSPDDFDINQRSMVITLNVKITDDVLYRRMMYDPSDGAAWVADMYQEADMNLTFDSPTEAEPGVPYSINIDANAANDNIFWSATPIALRAGRQIVMRVTGVTTGLNSGEPMTVSLTNQEASY